MSAVLPQQSAKTSRKADPKTSQAGNSDSQRQQSEAERQRRQQELEEAQQETAKCEAEWSALLAELTANAAARAVQDKLLAAVKAFKAGLQVPENYESEEGIAYSDTDDYADFTPVESAVEEVLDEVRPVLEYSLNASQTVASSFESLKEMLGSTGHRPVSPPPPPSSGTSSTHRKGDSEEQMKRRRCALLKLLVLSLVVGRLPELCNFASIPDSSNAPVGDAEDMKEEVASVWQAALHGRGPLTASEKQEWCNTVTTFLGPPFDSLP